MNETSAQSRHEARNALREAEKERDSWKDTCELRTKQLSERLEQINALKGENIKLRRGVKGMFDLDAWLDWTKEAKWLRTEVERFKEDYQGACQLVAEMHAAAVGEVTGPSRGVVEDVTDLRAEVKRLEADIQEHIKYNRTTSILLKETQEERDQFEEGYKSRTKQLDNELLKIKELFGAAPTETENENKELWELLDNASSLIAEGASAIDSEFSTFTNPQPAGKFHEWLLQYEIIKELQKNAT